ncbi:uncharacterized protein F5Z01DRAFT_678020 [Emericellopsis atlantica]|uniref:Uncharacterized protein n=1 Tax=Emericellopsis atlantica TaxID=2614577 RepID=A0A9P7ZEC1_9HYPO|nr:uncharacterized protein F5Z01DRAFT_678020 [Emericellopsis atlantica]KAG9250222.1 hypothetical protein F5Z01DRAFT_678020 [Emericellopsis atlantica]
MSTTLSTVPTPSAATCHNVYEIPVQDSACAMAYSDDAVDYFESCCKSADVYSYGDDCGLYCVASGQTVEELTACLIDEGAQHGQVFCSGNTTATATGDGEPYASATATVISDSSDNNDKNDDKNGDKDSDNKDGGDNSNSDDGDNDNAAVKSSVSVFGVVMGAMLFSGMTLAAW